MNTLKKIAVIAIIMTSATSWAWVSTPQYSSQYSFKFNYKGQIFTVEKSASSYEEAFDVAAQKCFQNFKGKTQLSEDQGLDIIDACANPRTTKI